VVTEQLGFTPAGKGEHLWLWIKKRNLNTLQVREYLAQQFKIPAKHIGYSGLKDKVAICQQWFSLPSQIDIPLNQTIQINDGEFEVLQAIPHQRKLNIGTHKSNHFTLTLRALSVIEAVSGIDNDNIEEKLLNNIQQIKTHGFPNYFGVQRFGYQGKNIPKAIDWLNTSKKISKEKKGIYLSSLRSFIFNELLATRVIDKTWNQHQANDKLLLTGTQSFFSIDENNPQELSETKTRLLSGDISIAGAMISAKEDLKEHELHAIDKRAHGDMCSAIFTGLATQKITLQRRPLGVWTKQLETTIKGDTAELRFALPKGAFATSLLSEIGRIN